MSNQLSNDDFRRLVSNTEFVNSASSSNSKSNNDGRVGMAGDSDVRGFTDASKADAKRDAKKKKRAERARMYMERKKKAEERRSEYDVSSKYRDRAKELREGKNTEYEVDPDVEKMGYEWTKYLGGDMAHTHLVKGLDFTLYRQVRERIEQEQAQEIEQALEESIEDSAMVTKDAQPTPMDTRMDDASTSKYLGMSEMHFKSSFARSIYRSVATQYTERKDIAMEQVNTPMKPKEIIEKQLSEEGWMTNTAVPPSDRCTLFLPGRMTFEFEIDDPQSKDKHKDTTEESEIDTTSNCRSGQFYVPTATIHSTLAIEQQGHRKITVSGWTPVPLRNKIGDIFRQNEAMKKIKKKSRKRKVSNISTTQNQTQPSTVVHNSPKEEISSKEKAKMILGDDFDIFDDAGREYKCNVDDPEEEESKKIPKWNARKRRRVNFNSSVSIVTDTVNESSNAYFGKSDKSAADSNPKPLKSALKKRMPPLESAEGPPMRFAGVGVINLKPNKKSPKDTTSVKPKRKPKDKNKSSDPFGLRSMVGSSEMYDDDFDEDYEMESSKSKQKVSNKNKKKNTAKQLDAEWKEIQDHWAKKK